MPTVAELGIQRNYPDNPSAQEIVRRNVNAMKAVVFGLAKYRKSLAGGALPKDGAESAGTSQAIQDDPWTRLERDRRIVAPPFDTLTLAMMPENNTELGPCIDAMAVNIESFGWRAEPRISINEQTPIDILLQLEGERVVAENFFENAGYEGESIEELRDKLRRDLEATGNCYLEFITVPGSGELNGLNHLPAWTMRIGMADDEATEYLDPTVRKRISTTVLDSTDPELNTPSALAGEVVIGKRFGIEVRYELVEQTKFKCFRRYAQLRGSRVVWFKELGDPRLISALDGRAVTREDLLREDFNAEVLLRYTLVGDAIKLVRGTAGFPLRDAANSVRHRRLYCTRSPYGLPRYIGHLFAIFGSRAAEEINFTSFKNNNIPAMVVTVSNGKLDDQSVERIQEFVEASIAGDDNYSKWLLLEAEPVMEGMRDPGSMKIEVKPLTREQHTDALFVTYQDANDDRTRRAWRFPPVFVGKSTDFSGKTIEASRKLGDEQVFSPERDKVDRFLTRDVFLRLGIVWSKFKSNSPNVTENADLVRALASGEKLGALTPRIGRKLIGRVVNEDLGDVDTDTMNPDLPFSLTLAQIMKTDSATKAPGGGEPTSQGRAGLQVAGPGPDRTVQERVDAGDEPIEEDLDTEEESNALDPLTRLTQMIRAEVDRRFGGILVDLEEPI